MDGARLLGNASALRTRRQVFPLRRRAGPAFDPGAARLRAALSPHGLFWILDFGFWILNLACSLGGAPWLKSKIRVVLIQNPKSKIQNWGRHGRRSCRIYGPRSGRTR